MLYKTAIRVIETTYILIARQKPVVKKCLC